MNLRRVANHRSEVDLPQSTASSRVQFVDLWQQTKAQIHLLGVLLGQEK